MKDALTAQQKRVFDFLADSVTNRGVVPTLREVASHFDVNHSAIRGHLQALEKKGFVQRGRGARNIEILRPTRSAPSNIIPILGKVSAGIPILAVENIEEYVQIDPSILGSGDFGLRVQGDSMAGAGILDGDVVIVKQQETSDLGSIVVALLGDEVTVKRLQKNGDQVYLMPENTAYRPILCDENTKVIGQVVSLLRKLK